jgi:thioredoxin-dependent peroxiredoxin
MSGTGGDVSMEVGRAAPDFTLPGVERGNRRDYTLSEFRGRKIVLAFYPGDFTPG